MTIIKYRYLKRITFQSQLKVEKALMIGAYIIRKLDEAQKLPPDFLNKKEQLSLYKSKGIIVDHMNWHKIDANYYSEKVIKEDRDWRFIVNQIIHSFTLFISNDSSNKFDGFLFNSDKTKEQSMFFLPLETLLAIFLTISEGDITEAQYQRQFTCKDSKEKLQYNELKLSNAVYTYPTNFDIKTAITNSLNGEIYTRKNE